MEAAFVEIGLEKNGFLYVDEIVVPELEGKGQGRRIQDLIKRGEQVLVQAVKDPMKSKGARLTTEISLPGRFIVYVPLGEGLGVSRRLEDDERTRLKEIVKGLKLKTGGVIVRTAAEGASAEDVERDLAFLQKLWKSIQAQAKLATPPSLVYQESELPLRVTRDLFTDDFERALVDDDTAYKRIVGYLKKTSPHMVEKVQRYKEKTPLFESSGVDDEIRSTLNRRVDLPSGGYLIFDYAEAFTVIDVNTGRFVGSRSRSSGARLEDTITKNNLEAVKEVVRQLRLRDIGGIIVIDFIDMANPSNRATVEAALRTELERDRTKTYVVEISPLGLVEMTRQNVTDGPREILTKKCPTCAGDGIVVSETTAAVDLERKLRALAASKPRTKAFRVEVAARPGSLLIGPGASRLEAIEASTKRRFFLELKDGIHTDHFAVLAEGTIAKLAPEAPVDEGAEVELKLVEVGLYDPSAAVAKLDGIAVTVAGAAKLVGKKVGVRVHRVLDGTAYATLVDAVEVEQPITAEREAEKPTRASRAKTAGGRGREADARSPREGGTESEGRDRDASRSRARRRPRRPSRPKTPTPSRSRRRRRAVARVVGAAAASRPPQRAATRGRRGRRAARGRRSAHPRSPTARSRRRRARTTPSRTRRATARRPPTPTASSRSRRRRRVAARAAGAAGASPPRPQRRPPSRRNPRRPRRNPPRARLPARTRPRRVRRVDRDRKARAEAASRRRAGSPRQSGPSAPALRASTR